MKKFDSQLLMILCEECGEVIQGVSKGVRFGFDNKHNSDLTNAEKVGYEMADLVAVYEMLVERGMMPEISDELKVAKKEKVQRLFDNYSKDVK